MKSILLHVYEDSGLESRMQAAFDLARAFESHITCLHAIPFEDYLAKDPFVVARLPEEFSEKMRVLREAFQARIEKRLRTEGLPWDWVHVDDLPATALIRWSILSDVTIVSMAGPALYRDEPRPVAGPVATGAEAAVLAVPEGLERLSTDAPAVLAWNGSPEAAAAMKAALPLLRLAPEVHLLEVEEKSPPYPKDLAARYLSRHGVKVQIQQRQRQHGRMSAVIEESAIELGAGLIVMGAYGHSRLRETLFGGVTRDLVTECRLPVLLAH
jgi:nucleotide-binding universal stress UspA family protein